MSRATVEVEARMIMKWADGVACGIFKMNAEAMVEYSSSSLSTIV